MYSFTQIASFCLVSATIRKKYRGDYFSNEWRGLTDQVVSLKKLMALGGESCDLVYEATL